MVPRVCQFTEIYGAPSTSVYIDLKCVNLLRFCRDFMVPRIWQFTADILHDEAKRAKYL